MSTIGSVILAGVLIAVFTALLTYFITTLTSRGYTKKAISEGLETHVGMHHKTDYGVMIESKKLELEGTIEKGLKTNHNSIVNAHKRIDETNKSVNTIAIDIAEIKTGQKFILDYIKGKA